MTALNTLTAALETALNDLRESEQCREELHARLREVAIALKRPEGEQQMHGFVDLPKLAACAHRDAARLMHAMQFIDGFNNVAADKYIYASIVAANRGHAEPDALDELDGVRDLIDASISLKDQS